MATLPTYQSREQLRAPRNASAGSLFRQVGQDVSTAITKRQEYDTQIELAEQKNQVDLAKINTNKAVALLDERYKADPMAFKEGEYEDSLNKIRDEQSATISSTEGAAAYDLDTSFGFTKAGIGARAIRGDAVIKQGKQNTLDTLSGIGQQDVLDSSGNFNPALIKMRMQQGEKAISEAEQFKFVSPQEADKLRKEGTTSAVLSDASRGSRYARDVMKKLQDPTDTTYTFKDPADRKAAFTQTKGLLDMMEYREEVDVESDKVLMQRAVSEVIANPNASAYQKMVGLKNMGMGDAEQNRALGVLNTSIGVQAETDNRVHKDLVNELSIVNTMIGTTGAAESPGEYFKRIQAFRDKVDDAYISKQIGPDNYAALLQDIDRDTTAKMAQATGAKLEKDDFGYFDPDNSEEWENSSVYDKMVETFPNQQNATLQMFSDYMIAKNADRENDTAQNRKKIFDDLVKRQNANQRTQAQRIISGELAPHRQKDAEKQDQYRVDGIYTVGGSNYKYLGNDEWEAQ